MSGGGKAAEGDVAHPDIATREAWLERRRALLEEEKDLTRHGDAVAAQRRRLPMVPVEASYRFDGPDGGVSLRELFGSCRQLIVYHFMFDPDWDEGCSGCTGYVDALGDLSMLAERDTAFVLISRAPLAKLEDYRKRRGWDRRWVSSFGSPFNYDFHVTLDPSVAPLEYNYRHVEPDEADDEPSGSREAHGMSVFFRLGGDVFHSYSSYARGVESVTDAYALLDRTPYGRQEDFEDSPDGWPQRPTYG